LDFENYYLGGLPFLDIITLLFDPILMSREYKDSHISLSDLIEKFNLKTKLSEWLDYYSDLSQVSRELIRLAIPFAALERKTERYPETRNPESFPIYKDRAFKELLKLRI